MRAGIGHLPVAALLVVGSASAAQAAEGTEIASAFDEGDPFDLHIGVSYTLEANRTAIKREWAAFDSPSSTDVIPVVKDLVYQQTRHIITPSLAVGVFHDTQLYAALPIVLSDNREFVFDQRADPCIFSGDPNRDPTCINRDNSTTLSFDGLLPNGPTLGYDAQDPLSGFPVDSLTVFRGVERKGLDQIHLGLTVAPLNQARDDTKPTWVVGAEFRLSIGQIMRFDWDNPGEANGVSRGVDEFRAYTGLSKRTRWAEPFVFFWWQAPYRLRGTDPQDPESSLWWDVGYGQENIWPQQQAGTTFGFEAIPWENVRQKQKISIEFKGRLEAHFEGRGYSEMWEILAYAGDVTRDPNAPLAVDPDPTAGTDDAPISFPGTTDIENYLTFGGSLGVRGQMGERARFGASFGMSHDQAHRITWTDAGDEGPDDDLVVTPGTDEVNPLHKPQIDLVGRRYIADENSVYTFFVHGALLF